MDFDFYKNLINNSPTSYAYYNKISGRDYELIGCNYSFEQLSGQLSNDLIGKSLSYIMSELFEFNDDLFLTDTEKNAYEHYSVRNNKWYRISAFYPKEGYLVTSFTDVSNEKLQLEEYYNFFNSASDIFERLHFEGKMIYTALRKNANRSKNEKEFRGNEENYKLMIENSHDIIYKLNPQGIITYVSPSWTKHLGYNTEQVVGKSFKDFMHNDDYLSCIDFLKKALDQEGELDRIICRFKHTDGTWRWHATHVTLIKDENGGSIGFVAIGRDITDQKKAEKIIFNEKELFKTTLMSVGDGVISTDAKGNVIVLNRVAERLTGWTQEEAYGRPLDEIFNIINEFNREKCENPVLKVLATGNIIELAAHTMLISKDGTEKPIEDSAAPIKDEQGNITGVVLVFRDFTGKKAIQNKINFLNYHDQLTGLYNRRYYEQEVQRLDNESYYPLTLIMTDVNGLKLTNDAFGHIFGDELLKKVSAILKNECRSTDILARIGGDEFVILLPKTDMINAKQIISHINSAISSEKIDNIMLSVSIGYAVKEEKNTHFNEVFMKAEDDMYRHKLYESSSMRSKTVKLILNSLFEKNNREMLHSSRVSEICEAIASKMNFDKNHINQIRIAGLMHDIGKIAISDAILNKPHNLDNNEWKEIERHSEIGYRILNSVNEFSEIAAFVLEHHEKWNGKGYPKGLKEEEISVQARIIAVADAFDAMTSDRAYRKALDEDNAIAEIKKCSQVQFDPVIVRVFIEQVLGKKW